jgi:hypothetical protein
LSEKGFLALAALSLAAAACAFGTMGELVNSFPNTGTSTHYGMAADASYLYSYYYSSPYNTMILNKSDGSLVGSFPCPLGTTSPGYIIRGVSYQPGGYLWYCNYSAHVVAQVVASSGSLVSSGGWDTGNRYGICVTSDGTPSGVEGVLLSSYSGGYYWYYNTAGSMLSSYITGTSTYAYDLAFDYGNNYIWYGNVSTEHVMGMTTDGSIIASWRVPADVTNPYGVAYWGDYLYVGTAGGTPDEYIWVYHCPNPTSSITPASLGKVKALYR